MSRNNESIAAVVVTFNRLNLLKECISSLLTQSRKIDEIIVVNNSSTDGTNDWLIKQKYLTVITQENSGSAGGQHTGIKTAYEKGFDWIWCMDDDLKPTRIALEIMLEFVHNKKMDNIAAVQLLKKSFSSDEHFNDGADYLEIKTYKEKKIASKALKEGFVETNLFSFEGVMINSCIIKSVGLPQKDYFCFYDDKEYALRIKKIFPQKNILLIGKVALENIKYKDNIKEKNIDEYAYSQVNNFCLFMRNLIITYRIHFPQYIKIKGIIYMSINYKKWIVKILFLVIMNKKRGKLFRMIVNEIYSKGFKSDLNSFNDSIYYYKN